MIFYLNNYRGFIDTFINTLELNILVGENSTGKSSFLAIISLLSDPEFIIQGQFKNPYVDLGPFDEIITKSSTSSDKINVGVIKEKNKSAFDTEIAYDGILLSFNSKSGFTNLCEIILIMKESAFRIEYQTNQIKYSLKKIQQGQESIKMNFHEWSINDNFESEIIDGGIIGEKEEGAVFDFFKRYLMSFMLVFDHVVKKNKIHFYKDFQNMRYFGSEGILIDTICMAPIRTIPKRIYEPEVKKYSANGTHIPSVLRNIYMNKENIKYKKIIDGLESFGESSGLFDKISIDPYREDTELSPFELNIELFMKKLKITNVGYGVSQILPILTEILIQGKKSVFLVQQPEIHLHPKAQASFGEFIYNQYIDSKKNFFIETHSDFIVDRLRLKIRKSRVKNIHKRVNVLFFQNTPDGLKVIPIQIEKNGDYSKIQPKAFREFFLKEELDFLGFK